MEGIQQPTQNFKLVQKSGTYNYKLIIPDKVERKIRFACQRVWNTEWSGTLFFTYKGSFENNDLVIRCVDIYIMDIGTQTYTEFDMNPDVIAYMCENPELLDCQLGLIHSHNNMSTFFSGTDTATLKEEGRDRNNFVSLIVNNEGTYTAAITRKVKRYSQIKDTLVYEFFGEGEKQDKKEYTQNGVEEIEWFYLNIVKEGNTLSFQDMDTRFEEIKKRKAEKVKESKTYKDKPFQTIPYKKVTSNNSSKDYIIQPSLFDDIDYIDTYKPYNELDFDKNIIKQLTLQLVTGSIIISDSSKIDIKKWASSMPALYQKRFGKGDAGMQLFALWADTYTEFIVWYTVDDKLKAQGVDEAEMSAMCAYGIIEELSKLPENEYINVYIDTLQKYLSI